MEKCCLEPRSVIKIENNPEMPNHLKTANSTNILGLDIDFVNLRSETFSEESRIPHMVCSTLSWDFTLGVFTVALGIQNPREQTPSAVTKLSIPC